MANEYMKSNETAAGLVIPAKVRKAATDTSSVNKAQFMVELVQQWHQCQHHAQARVHLWDLHRLSRVFTHSLKADVDRNYV
jgi:hypothetical protein